MLNMGIPNKESNGALSQNVCECGCKVPAKLLMSLCRTFWSLPKTSQDAPVVVTATGNFLLIQKNLVTRRTHPRIGSYVSTVISLSPCQCQ